jgi:hypothetical protein
LAVIILSLLCIAENSYAPSGRRIAWGRHAGPGYPPGAWFSLGVSDLEVSVLADRQRLAFLK